MKCTKRSSTVLCFVLGVPLSLSIGRLNARDADDATSTLARAQTAKQQSPAVHAIATVVV